MIDFLKKNDYYDYYYQLLVIINDFLKNDYYYQLLVIINDFLK